MKRLPVIGEISWLLGTVLMALGVSLVSVSCFGYSMIAAPVYLLYRRIDLVSFGTMEYLFQGFLLIIMCVVVRRVRARYLCSFFTAVCYGLVFDLFLYLTSFLPAQALSLRVLWFLIGEYFIASAVVFFVHTDMAPALYELFVKELADGYRISFPKVKMGFDMTLLALSLILSLAFFGPGALADPAALPQAMVDGYILEGIGLGTLAAALVNGPLIAALDRLYTAVFAFRPACGIGKLLRYGEGNA